MPGLVLKVYWL